MTLQIKHPFVSAKPASNDPTRIDGPKWNADHQITGTLGIAEGGTGQTSAGAAFDALAPTTTRGDLIARGATSNVRLPAGTSGYHLQSAGAAADPAWTGFLQSGTGAVTRTWQVKV